MTTKDFSALFDKYHGPLIYFGYNMINNIEDIENIVADAFMRLWERREGFDSEKTEKAYLYTCVKNACLDYYKHSNIIKKFESSIELNERIEEEITHGIIKGEVLRAIYLEIESLPQQPKQVLKMMLFEGMGPTEISKKLGLAISTVDCHRLRAIKLIRTSLIKKELL
jgi:RNA polymerase sigma-70 factor (ECF subfamily)